MMRFRFWRRRKTSEGLKQAEAALAEVRRQSAEASELSSALKSYRTRNGLVPLISEAIRNVR